MATIKAITLPIDEWVASHGVAIHQWKDVGAEDECLPVTVAAEDDVSVQVSGSLDGSRVTLLGTLDKDIPVTVLHDKQANELEVFAYPIGYKSALVTVADPVRLLNPVVRGSGKPCVTITLMARK